ncbi:MAG: MarR family winged helix-turn-helix transcriptional regulator [Xanthomonadales bacterium]|nr:MarR family winged helix-turn-helix transcriptional regulator [Xanthomonadales bacterium]
MLKIQDSPDQFMLEQFLPYRLSLLSNTISEGIARTYRREFGLSVTEWRVLAVLGRFPGLTASDIRSRTAMDKVAISRAVRGLQDRGLVERSEHRQDRRRQLLWLSDPQGKELFAQVVPRALEYEQRLLEALKPGDAVQLGRLLERLQQQAAMLNEA